MNMSAPSLHQPALDERPEIAFDICALPLVRRLSALLDRDPGAFVDGAPLPHGWHVIMFNVPTRQSRLRPDGATELGVTLPDLGLPRLMMGGRRIDFTGEIPIGGHVRRESRLLGIAEKTGRSGRFALVEIEHRLLADNAAAPALIETTSYILRDASDAPAGAAPASNASADIAPPTPAGSAPTGKVIAERIVVPDEPMLFRYSSVTDNPHRIHYDLPYAQKVEGFPSLLVNGTIPSMLLLEMFRETTGREPAQLESRNIAPMYCGREMNLSVVEEDEGWVLLARNQEGALCMRARAW